MTAPRHYPPALAVAGLTMALASLVAVAGCGTSPAVGPVPDNTIHADSSPGFSTPPAEALKIEINIDQKTVTPLEKEFEVVQGRSVVLVTRSDHDTSLTVTGPGISRTEFIGRLSTISTTFDAEAPGVIMVESTDPAATIARLTVR